MNKARRLLSSKARACDARTFTRHLTRRDTSARSRVYLWYRSIYTLPFAHARSFFPPFFSGKIKRVPKELRVPLSSARNSSHIRHRLSMCIILCALGKISLGAIACTYMTVLILRIARRVLLHDAWVNDWLMTLTCVFNDLIEIKTRRSFGKSHLFWVLIYSWTANASYWNLVTKAYVNNTYSGLRCQKSLSFLEAVNYTFFFCIEMEMTHTTNIAWIIKILF